MKKFICLFFSLMVCALTLLTVAAQEKSVALTPQPVDAEWWTQRHTEKCELMKKGDIDLLMIGDSITHGWEGQKDVWDQFYSGRKILNLGFSGDRTEHILWRLLHSPLDAIHPKAATIMIGTNNIGHGSSNSREAAEGIRAIVDLLQEKFPEIKIYVLYVFPRDNQPDGVLRVKVNEINSYLPELLWNVKNVTLVDINERFLDEDGTLPADIMPDFLHPNTRGYVLWAEAVEPILKPVFD